MDLRSGLAVIIIYVNAFVSQDIDHTTQLMFSNATTVTNESYLLRICPATHVLSHAWADQNSGQL